jgi:hypothetical protein
MVRKSSAFAGGNVTAGGDGNKDDVTAGGDSSKDDVTAGGDSSKDDATAGGDSVRMADALKRNFKPFAGMNAVTTMSSP